MRRRRAASPAELLAGRTRSKKTLNEGKDDNDGKDDTKDTEDVGRGRASAWAKRRKLRKGTFSCLECKRRKVRCQILGEGSSSSACVSCQRYGTQCVGQEYEVPLPPSSLPPPSSPPSLAAVLGSGQSQELQQQQPGQQRQHNGLGERISQVEALVDELMRQRMAGMVRAGQAEGTERVVEEEGVGYGGGEGGGAGPMTVGRVWPLQPLMPLPRPRLGRSPSPSPGPGPGSSSPEHRELSKQLQTTLPRAKDALRTACRNKAFVRRREGAMPGSSGAVSANSPSLLARELIQPEAYLQEAGEGGEGGGDDGSSQDSCSRAIAEVEAEADAELELELEMEMPDLASEQLPAASTAPAASPSETIRAGEASGQHQNLRQHRQQLVLEQRHAAIVGRIAARNERLDRPGARCRRGQQVYYDDAWETRDIDYAFQQAAQGLPARWWAVPDMVSAAAAAPVAGLPALLADARERRADSAARILGQSRHFYLLVLLHLPYLTDRRPRVTAATTAATAATTAAETSSTVAFDTTYSKMSAVSAAREVLARSTAFWAGRQAGRRAGGRPSRQKAGQQPPENAENAGNTTSFCVLDVQAFVACAALLLAHLDGHGRGRASAVQHQRLADVAAATAAVDRLAELSHADGEVRIGAGAELLRRLLAAEAEAAEAEEEEEEGVQAEERGSGSGPASAEMTEMTETTDTLDESDLWAARAARHRRRQTRPRYDVWAEEGTLGRGDGHMTDDGIEQVLSVPYVGTVHIRRLS